MESSHSHRSAVLWYTYSVLTSCVLWSRFLEFVSAKNDSGVFVLPEVLTALEVQRCTIDFRSVRQPMMLFLEGQRRGFGTTLNEWTLTDRVSIEVSEQTRFGA